MDAITFRTAEEKLAETMDTVCENHEPVIVTRHEREPVVILSLADYNGIMETLHLLDNPRNASRLRRSLADADAGRTIPVEIDAL